MKPTLALLAAAALSLWPTGLCNSTGRAISASRFGPSIYVRAAFGGGSDKVWRVLADPGAVTDFAGERLIPAAVPGDVWHIAPAFFRGTTIKNGGDESPAVRLDGLMFGGHHSPAQDYRRTILLDGRPLPDADTEQAASLIISESYTIPAQARVAITWTFDGSLFVRFRYSLTPLRPLAAILFGQQWQRLALQPGERARLIVPGLEPIDITEPRELAITPDLWAGQAAPIRADVIVARDGRDQHGFAMAYDPDQPRGELSASFYISTFGKLYPQAFNSGEHYWLIPGQTKTITGYFGGYAIDRSL